MDYLQENNAIDLKDINLLEEDGDSGTILDEEGIDKEDNEKHSEDVVSPCVGMYFDSVDDVKKFYKEYAIKSGFRTRIRTSRKDDDNQLCYFKLVCSREGKCVSSIPPEMKTLPTQRKQCPACITVVRREDKWMISNVVHEHNHDVSPSKSRLIRGNRKLNMQAKRTLDINDEAGVRIHKSFLSLVCDAGGFENLHFVERDARNYIGQQRRALGKEGDGQALLNHFSSMRELNKDFFFEIDVDVDNRITNIFWADGRSRAACADFGDIVSFDTTYLTNKYDMPFAPFVGVNHHGQSILLGCELICAEDTCTFV